MPISGILFRGARVYPLHRRPPARARQHHLLAGEVPRTHRPIRSRVATCDWQGLLKFGDVRHREEHGLVSAYRYLFSAAIIQLFFFRYPVSSASPVRGSSADTAVGAVLGHLTSHINRAPDEVRWPSYSLLGGNL